MARPREFNKPEALSAAMHVFWEKGFSDASMQELCDAMGINPGSLYAAFGSKQDLFSAAIKHYLSLVTQEGINKLEASPDGIHDYFKYMVEGILNGPRNNGCFGANSFLELSQKDEEIHTIMTNHFLLLEAAFQNALIKDGVPDAQAQARHLVCVAQGLNVLARTSPDKLFLDQIVSTTLAPLQSARLPA